MLQVGFLHNGFPARPSRSSHPPVIPSLAMIECYAALVGQGEAASWLVVVVLRVLCILVCGFGRKKKLENIAGVVVVDGSGEYIQSSPLALCERRA